MRVRGIVLAASIAAALGVLPSPAYAAPAPIGVIGDSNLAFADAALDAALTRPIVNVAKPSTWLRWDRWPTRIARTKGAGAYVINLGVNDTTQVGTSTGRGYSSYAAKIDWLLGKLDSKPAVWSNLPCKILPAPRAHACGVINTALNAARKRHANLTVANWAQVANTHPEWIAADGFKVHYTSAGYAAYAKLIKAALNAR